MTPSPEAEKKAEHLADKLSSCMANCYLCDEHIDMVAAALREAWEGGHLAGTKFLESVNEYHKQADADGYARGIEEAAKVCENPYSDEVEAYGPDEPLTVGSKIAKALRALAKGTEKP